MEIGPLGMHQVTQEAPDLLCFRLVGRISADEAREMVRADRNLWRERGYALVLVDARQAGAFEASARQAAFDELKRYPGYRGTSAIFGLSPYLGVLVNLLSNALRLLGEQDDEVRCFKDEPAARAFLESRREARRQPAGQGAE